MKEDITDIKRNIFLENQKEVPFEEYLHFDEESRGNLGDSVPLAVYRLLEYSLKKELSDEFGKEKQVEIFRKAGYRAGEYFAKSQLDLSKPMNEFIAELQQRLVDMKIGVLRIESVDEETGEIWLTVSEDADCSGLPTLGETVCNYDEGFLSGVLSSYSGKPYSAIEIDCWATGNRVCRFQAK